MRLDQFELDMKRREFLTGAAAFGLGGWRLFAAPPGWKHGGKPNLVFGVVSDTHLRTALDGKSVDRNYTDRYFLAALQHFRKQKVDAVMRRHFAPPRFAFSMRA